MAKSQQTVSENNDLTVPEEHQKFGMTLGEVPVVFQDLARIVTYLNFCVQSYNFLQLKLMTFINNNNNNNISS